MIIMSYLPLLYIYCTQGHFDHTQGHFDHFQGHFDQMHLNRSGIAHFKGLEPDHSANFQYFFLLFSRWRVDANLFFLTTNQAGKNGPKKDSPNPTLTLTLIVTLCAECPWVYKMIWVHIIWPGLSLKLSIYVSFQII